MPKQVRTLSVYRKLIERLPEFRLISPPLTVNDAQTVGFDGLPEVGDSIVPAAIGKGTTFNANGKTIKRTDLPMETRSRMIHTSWEDWHGQTHYGVQYRDYEAYPLEQVPAPGEMLTAVENDGNIILTSRVISRDEPESDIVVLLNLFLEIFPTFEIVTPDFAAPVEVRKLNWRILPPGQYPFKRAIDELGDYLARLPENEQPVVRKRIETITRYNPDFVAVGMGGFSDYVVFGFTDKQRYVLESPHVGNATYVFRNDWEDIAHLTKREILEDGLQEIRLIHNSNWSRQIGHVINSP